LFILFAEYSIVNLGETNGSMVEYDYTLMSVVVSYGPISYMLSLRSFSFFSSSITRRIYSGVGFGGYVA
jgi:hypothetical protein